MTGGIVLSCTRVHRAPTGFSVPFVLILAQVESGERWARGTDAVELGDTVRLVADGATWRFSRV